MVVRQCPVPITQYYGPAPRALCPCGSRRQARRCHLGGDLSWIAERPPALLTDARTGYANPGMSRWRGARANVDGSSHPRSRGRATGRGKAQDLPLHGGRGCQVAGCVVTSRGMRSRIVLLENRFRDQKSISRDGMLVDQLTGDGCFSHANLAGLGPRRKNHTNLRRNHNDMI